MATIAGYIVNSTNIADHPQELMPADADLTYRQMAAGMTLYPPPTPPAGNGTRAYGYIA